MEDIWSVDVVSDDREQPQRRPRRGRTVALVAAGVVAGGTLAGAAGAFAASGSPSPSTSSSGATGSSGTTAPKTMSPGGAATVRSDEKVLTGTDAEKAKAAALKAVPGGTVIRLETDAGDGVYEAHMKKADGTLVTVKLDKNFAVTKVESGMGLGDPRGKGGGDGDGDGPGHGSGGTPE
jgi:hypothetical protein